MQNAPQTNKAHRPAASGPSALRKRSKASKAASNNPRAFAFASGRSAARSARRSLDHEQKRLHVPLVDRSPLAAPPIVVAVVGPPKTGKTTLIRSLVKRYSKHSLSETHGPITVVSGKARRITFIECNNDLNAMIDIAKVADLVLLLIDASFGFEMETFEFLNVLQVHGFPRVMGVLTHLDKFKDNKRLRKVKKRLKQRFWTEIYQGAKLFYLSGISASGQYPKTEILNLSRFISVLKFRPLIWRNAHPYLLADRVEDISDPELIRQNPKSDRTVVLFGYLRGSNLKTSSRVHIPGVGDFSTSSISILEDPCPFPEKSRRSLSNKQKLIHAPMSDVGGILYDRDAVYINLPASATRARTEGDSDVDLEALAPGEHMLLDLQKAQSTIADNVCSSQLRIFNSSAPIVAKDMDSMHDAENDEFSDDDDMDSDADHIEEEDEEDNDDDDDDDESDEEEVDTTPDEFGRNRRRVARHIGRYKTDEEQDGPSGSERIPFADSDSDMGLSDEEVDDDASDYEEEDDDMDDQVEIAADGSLRWKEDMIAKAEANFKNLRRINLSDYVYHPEKCEDAQGTGSSGMQGGMDDDDDELFRVRSRSGQSRRQTLRDVDTCKFEIAVDELDVFADDDALDSLRSRFVTGKHSNDADPAEEGEKEEEEVFGDFEDLENPENSNSQQEKKEPESADDIAKERDANARRKEELKKKFDAEYDGKDDEDDDGNYYETTEKQMADQMELNRAEFEDEDPETRAQIEGYRAGTYVRIVIEGMPCEFIERFDPDYPVLIGGLLPTEQNFGFVQVRIKKHRWYKRILKTNDPLIFSLGWRRFQSLPLFSINTDATRNRMLKYTPEHMHCLATFYGPVTPQNTGFCCFQSVSDVSADFRVAATGVVLDIDRTTEVVKKLKLTGTPLKVFKNTAFIKDMFNSSLEVAKFEGASIRTVSGIRGQIKRAVSKPEGGFRATFEDKILMSDIVFLRAWYPVKPKKFYNPVSSLLLSKKSEWRGMRTTGQIRKEDGIRLVQNKDSLYKPIERQTRRFNKLRIPKSLQSNLPFSSKPKLLAAQRRPTYAQRRAVVMEPHERKIASLIQAINTIKNDKSRKREEKMKEKRSAYLKKKEKNAAVDKKMQGERSKEFYKEMGKKRSREESGSSQMKRRKKRGSSE